MKTLIAVTLMFVFAAFAFAADTGKMEKDGNNNVVQGAAPRGDKTIALTGVSYTTDGSGVWWGAYCTTDAKVRTMVTSAKGANKTWTIPALTRVGYVINKGTPFVNISGCTGDMIRQ